jgi:hypothetical protein
VPPTATATRTATNTPIPTATPTTAAPYEKRINCGSGDYTDAQGKVWVADEGYVGGFVPVPSTFDIINTTDDPLFQIDRRWYGSADPAYSFVVPNGQYEVTLRFAETDQSTAGTRIFSVGIEGATVLNNFDIFAAAGGWKLVVERTFPVTVSDGTLTISVVSNKLKPKINTIYIKQLN